ncbi:hypothetical protein ACRAWF_25660 [Streptomyces sp. L7]
MLAVVGDIAYLAIPCRASTGDAYQRQIPAVTAVDLTSARRPWTEQLLFRSAKSDEWHFLAAKVVGDRLLLLQEMNDGKVRVVARNTRTGKVVWDKPWDVEPAAAHHPLTADGKRLSPGHRTAAGAAAERRRARPGGGRGQEHGPPVLKDGVVYAVQKGLGLVGVDAAGGKPRWSEKGGDGAQASLTSRPVIGSRVRVHVQQERGGAAGDRPRLAHHRPPLQGQRGPLHRPAAEQDDRGVGRALPRRLPLQQHGGHPAAHSHVDSAECRRS